MKVALLADADCLEALVAQVRAVYDGPLVTLPLAVHSDVPPEAQINQVLAEPGVEAVVVWGTSPLAAEAVRQASQAGLRTLCSVPLAGSIDVHYELAVVAEETGAKLLPFWPWLADPCFDRLRAVVQTARAAQRPLVLELDVQAPRITEALAHPVLFEAIGAMLRLGLKPAEVLASRDPTGVLEVRSECGGAVSWVLRAWADAETRVAISARDDRHARELWVWGDRCRWEGRAVHEPDDGPRRLLANFLGQPEELPGWDAVTGTCEVVEAARTSLQRRRAEPVSPVVASPETRFKATATLYGCGLLWLGLIVGPLVAVLDFLDLTLLGIPLSLVVGIPYVVLLVVYLAALFLKPRAS